MVRRRRAIEKDDRARADKTRLRIPIPKARLVSIREAKLAGIPYEAVDQTGVCRVVVEDLWITTEDGPWVIGYRLAVEDGRLVIGELRVYPSLENDMVGPQPWSDRRLIGIRGPVPKGGLTASVVHRIKPGTDVNDVGRLILAMVRQNPTLWPELQSWGIRAAEAPPVDRSHRRGGQAGLGIAFYRRVAAVYSAAQSHPVQAVATALNLTPAKARDAVHRCRNRYHLLPKTARGRVAGHQVEAMALRSAKR